MPFRVIESDDEAPLFGCTSIIELIDFIDKHTESWNVKELVITSEEKAWG
tara:strand:+ start:605 stop:754 length:150 start_codon:yes stop_codon:yes gene_type:complete